MFKTTFVFLVLLVSVHLSLGIFSLKKCPTSNPCTSLNKHDCPEMVDLIRTRLSVNIQKVIANICGFRGRQVLVCCKKKIALSGAALLPTSCGVAHKQDRILGGDIAPRGAYPWMVALAYKEIGLSGTKFLCAGSLISERYVLTAAHCVDKNLLGAKRLKSLYIGDWNLSTDEDCDITQLGTICSPPHVIVEAEEVTMHPDYNVRAKTSDDIALIRLKRAVEFSSGIQPICLPPNGLNAERASQERSPIATGWGLTENLTQSDVLLRVYLPFNDHQICRDNYGPSFVGKQLCVGGIGGSDTCNGDSGAPLIIPGPKGPPFLQVGIVSFGPMPCGVQNKPGVYTSVSSYRHWIDENLKP